MKQETQPNVMYILYIPFIGCGSLFSEKWPEIEVPAKNFEEKKRKIKIKIKDKDKDTNYEKS